MLLGFFLFLKEYKHQIQRSISTLYIYNCWDVKMPENSFIVSMVMSMVCGQVRSCNKALQTWCENLFLHKHALINTCAWEKLIQKYTVHVYPWIYVFFIFLKDFTLVWSFTFVTVINWKVDSISTCTALLYNGTVGKEYSYMYLNACQINLLKSRPQKAEQRRTPVCLDTLEIVIYIRCVFNFNVIKTFAHFTCQSCTFVFSILIML